MTWFLVVFIAPASIMGPYASEDTCKQALNLYSSYVLGHAAAMCLPSSP